MNGLDGYFEVSLIPHATLCWCGSTFLIRERCSVLWNASERCSI